MALKKSSMTISGKYLRGAPWVVNGAGDEDSPSAIDENSLIIVGDGAVDQPRGQKQKQEEES